MRPIIHHCNRPNLDTIYRLERWMLDSLTLDQMRVLIAVAESGSFSAAARRLGRVQSAVNQARWQPAAVAHIDDVDLLDIAGIVRLSRKAA
jgi:Bacterial regulatory helix-turn-helix protein, lysR family